MKEKAPALIFKQSLSFNPWAFFIIFLIANTLLSYYPFSVQIELFIIFFGLMLPFTLGFKIASDSKVVETNYASSDSFNLPTPLFVFIVSLILFTRFYHLTTMPTWIYIDEGYESALGIGLLNHWDWRLIWSPVPHEPLLNWLLGLYFKLSPPSLFSFRLFSSLISLATIGTAYWGARSFFSRRTSFLFALILAFSYWAFILSRLGIVVILIPLFQCFGFGCLGRLIHAKSDSARWWAWAGLTAFNILGFYSWTDWAGLGAALSLILFLYYWKHPSLPKIHLWGFYFISLLGVFPLVLARLAPGAMAHIGQIYHFNPLKAFIFNWVGIFWDRSTTYNFGSTWGGFLNPIFDSLILLGALFFFQNKSSFWRWILPVVFLLSFFPALMAPNDVELYRSLPLIVFLTLAAATGVNGLLNHSSKKINSFLAITVLLISIGIEFYNYTTFFDTRRDIPEKLQWRPSAYSQTYQILEKLSQQTGPLCVFSEFTTEYDNQTLEVALYPFNVLQNPALAQAHPQWTAVIANTNYVPYFVRTYPHTQVTLLRKGGDVNPSSVIALLILPTSDLSSDTLSEWKEADLIFRKINLGLLNKNPITPWNDIAGSFPPLAKSLKPDPLVTAVYWEKVALFNFKAQNFKKAVENYEAAIKGGYPAAHLYYDLGLSLKSIGEDQKANQAFHQATALSR